MTEAEWLACENPSRMLSFLQEKASSRRFWLFAVAGAELATQVLPEDVRQEIVRVGVGLAEGTAPHEERLRTWNFAQDRKERCIAEQKFFRAAILRDWQHVLVGPGVRSPGGTAEESGIVQNGLGAAQERGFRAARWVISLQSYPPTPLDAAYQTSLCATLREVFGNAHCRVSCHPDWLHWNDHFVAELAAVIYRERTFDRLPILGDALEDAGCTDEAILKHCRQPGPHVPGCWVVDLLLGKS
jgi:hypothetical protein